MNPLGVRVGQYQREGDLAASPPPVPSARLIAGAAAPPKERYDADIIILGLDRIEETLAAIASASAQRGVSVHIFVLDQGSCSQVLTRLEQAVQGRYDITLLSTERNLGVAGGRNLISGLGHGRVIVALDNDAEFASPDTVAQMVAVLDAEPRLGAIGCRIVTFASGNDDLSSWGYPIGLLPSAGESFDTVTYVGAGHAIRREAWQQAGGYDAGRSSISAFVRSPWAGISATAATSLFATRYVLNSVSVGTTLDGSTSYAIEFTSNGSWITAGSRCCLALPGIW